MKNMDSAPRGEKILLLFPEFEGFSKRWWVGMWSFVEEEWVISTPYFVNNARVIVTDLPYPLGWESLPSKD